VTLPGLKYLKNFNVIKVEGNSTKYTAALVYACSPEEEGYLRHDAIILSRDRNPPKESIKRWLNDFDAALMRLPQAPHRLRNRVRAGVPG